ncbi:MAG TPA: cytochrome b/b6 domain-containing protein [Roseomonas sp.]|jgi:cytochrome b561
MRPAGPVPAHAPAVRIMHWASAITLAATYLLAWTIADATSREEAARLLMLHRSLGCAMLLLTLLRLAIRLRSAAPPFPADMPRLQQVAARANALALYALLLLQPLAGLAGSMLHGDRIRVFGNLLLPNLLVANRPLAHRVFEAHGWIATALLALIGLHVAAALFHHLVRRDGVLTGMLPGLPYPPRRKRILP